jgi:hypothetical protein
MSEHQEDNHFMLTLAHHSHPNSAKGPLVHVKGKIAAVLNNDDNVDGGKHQHFQLLVEETISIKGGHGKINGQTLFVAVRFGDAQGLANPIPNLKAGSPIEAQGEYIDAMRARPGTDNKNPVLPVLHFTHHPIGFITYDGHKFA